MNVRFPYPTRVGRCFPFPVYRKWRKGRKYVELSQQLYKNEGGGLKAEV